MDSLPPLVSIGLCVRNGAEYLQGALDSLLNQTYKNLELVISDNASTDGTREICEEYAKHDKRIRYIRQKENIGSYGNYDFIRKETRGDYFTWAACDDFWDPRFVEKSITRFKEVPGASMVFPNFCAFDESGRIMKLIPEKYFPFDQNIYGRVKSYILNKTENGKITMIYGLWKRHAPADQISLGDCHGDMIYMLRTLLAGYFANVPEALFFKREPLQVSAEATGEKPSLNLLTKIPPEKYENIDKWHETRGEIEKKLEWRNPVKIFIANRIQSTKYLYKISVCILKSPDLNASQKLRLCLWTFYAYLKALWCGYM